METSEVGASAEATYMRVATATCTVGTLGATGRNTTEAGIGAAPAGLRPSTSGRIRPERWASSASVTSTGDSVPAESREDFTAGGASTAAAASTGAADTAAAGNVEPVTPQGTGGIPMKPWRSVFCSITLVHSAVLAAV